MNSNSQPAMMVKPQTSLVRDGSGRVMLPPLEALADGRYPYYFSDSDLHEIYQETCRRRRWWRLWTSLKVAVIVAFLLWTFWLMPAIALRSGPYR
jgi:hypothetical protein